MVAVIICLATIALILSYYFRWKESKSQQNGTVQNPPADIEQQEPISRKPAIQNDTHYVFRIDTTFPDSFTAIDFETATASQMACQLGIVRVDDNRIIQESSFLIQPPDNAYDKMNSIVHGISSNTTISSPTFDQLWPTIKPMLEGRYLVSHYSSFDKTVLGKNLEYYGLEAPEILGFGCTCGPFGNVSLNSATEYFGIELGLHHDALSDAKACALLALAYKQHFGEIALIPKLKETGRYSSVSKQNRGWADCIDDIPDNVFKKKTVVITGVLDSYPSRDELAETLKELGARVTSSISSRTAIVIVGSNAGPAKMDKIAELQAQGHDIEIFDEQRLIHELNKIQKTF